MLSEGRPGIDQVFSLIEGVLRLEVDKPTFERMGLQGKAIPNEGRKHVKARYAIELNLRLPSMVRGKSGFERILWACKNVLNQAVTWLFYDLNGANDGTGPIAAHQPIMKTVEAEVEESAGVLAPKFPSEIGEQDHEVMEELLEWLTLAAAGSSRVQKDDDMDSYLSRYQVPTLEDSLEPGAGHSTQDLAVFRWHGFLPSHFIQQTYLAALKACGEGWFSLSATAFDGRAYTILQDKLHTMTWEYND
jgi:ribonucleases P/MRP protein subunit RPP40